MNKMLTLLQREYWENRGSFAITPVVIGCFFVVILLFALFGSGSLFTEANDEMAASFGGIRINGVNISGFDFFAGLTKEFANVPLEQRITIWSMALYGLSYIFIMTLVFVSGFYLLGALYDDRRDRSILFWKSLPVSDLMTVTSKVVAVLVVLPVLFTIAIFLTFVAIMLIASIVALVSGGSLWASIWEPAPFITAPLKILMAHIIHTLWAAPILGWMLFVSSWTTRKPILVSSIPLGVITFLEFYYNSTVSFGTAVSQRLVGWFVPINFTSGRHLGDGSQIGKEMEVYNIVEKSTTFLSNPEFYYGLVIAAIFFAGAVYVRRFRDEAL